MLAKQTTTTIIRLYYKPIMDLWHTSRRTKQAACATTTGITVSAKVSSKYCSEPRLTLRFRLCQCSEQFVLDHRQLPFLPTHRSGASRRFAAHMQLVFAGYHGDL